MEEHDIEQLSNPETYIINKGGEVLFALYNDEIIGTCALIKTGEAEFEMAKMAVSPNYRGLQIGYKLGEYFKQIAIKMGAKRIWLESNRSLAPAISLYKKLGFNEIPIDYSPYARADIRMELWVDVNNLDSTLLKFSPNTDILLIKKLQTGDDFKKSNTFRTTNYLGYFTAGH